MSGFDDTAIKSLGKKLNPDVVKKRSQGNFDFSYIEGWHAIAEANRIFGFDGWNRETMHTSCVASFDCKLHKGKEWEKDGFSVTYSAKVRITVGNVAREGSGHGHGKSEDLGLAHESAEKEAETDAMKRAFMTFGNPFGLALYDKHQANVGHETVSANPKYDMCDLLYDLGSYDSNTIDMFIEDHREIYDLLPDTFQITMDQYIDQRKRELESSDETLPIVYAFANKTHAKEFMSESRLYIKNETDMQTLHDYMRDNDHKFKALDEKLGKFGNGELPHKWLLDLYDTRLAFLSEAPEGKAK